MKWPIEVRPDVVGIEKTDTVGERGKGLIGDEESARGRGGTGRRGEFVFDGGLAELGRSMGAVRERAVSVLSSSFSSENPKSSSSSEESVYTSPRVRFVMGVLSLSVIVGEVGSMGSSKSSSQFSGSTWGFGRGGV